MGLNGRFSKKGLFFTIIIIFVLIVATGGFYYWKHYVYLDPNSKETYYKIFDKNEILSGDEDNATIVAQKLDRRLAKYKKTFIKMAGTNDEKKLRALFIMNFVHMGGYYGKRTLQEPNIKDILWGSQYFHCGTNALLMSMLLEKDGYEYRTVSINEAGHGFLEVKFDGQWNLLDPTINVWFDKSTEELASGQKGQAKEFFMQAEDLDNQKARENLNAGFLCDIFCLKNQMLSIGDKFEVKIDKYNYLDLSLFTY